MAYTGAEYSLGFVEGFNRRRREQKAEATAAEDRARKIKREEAADTFTQETRDRQRKAWAAEGAEAPVRAEQRQLELATLRAKAEREGGLDFLYDLDAGDVNAAVSRYNARGTSKIDPRSVRIQGRRVQFTHSDTDGDGKPDTVTGDLDKMISAAERTLGRAPKNRYSTVSPGAGVLDERTGRIVAENPRDSAARANANRPLAVRADQALIDPTTRQQIYAGPQYGKPKAGAAAGAGGRKLTAYSPETYNRDLQKSFDSLFADLTDPKIKASTLPFTRLAFEEARRINARMPGAISPQEIARAAAGVALSFDEAGIRKEARERALADAENSETGWLKDMFDLNKPESRALKTIQDTAANAARTVALGNLRVALSYLEQDADARGADAGNSGVDEDEEQDSAAAAPAVHGAPAPREAVNHLRQHPEFKEHFRRKYGYLPPGF